MKAETIFMFFSGLRESSFKCWTGSTTVDNRVENSDREDFWERIFQHDLIGHAFPLRGELLCSYNNYVVVMLNSFLQGSAYVCGSSVRKKIAPWSAQVGRGRKDKGRVDLWLLKWEPWGTVPVPWILLLYRTTVLFNPSEIHTKNGRMRPSEA